jgi:hypothetical protein
MRRTTLEFTTLAAALMLASPAPTYADASGSINFRDAKWTVADAVAYPDDEEIEIVFTEAKLDRAEMAQDGKIDTFDIMRSDGRSITINVDADGPTMCIDFSTGNGGGSSCNSDFPPTITLTTRTADRVAGSMQWGETDGEHIHVRFDLPIEGAATGGKVARPGTPLPADGGEPGKAVKAHFAALTKGDWKQMKAISHPERVAMMEASEAEGNHMELFEMLRSFMPKNPKITGGTVDGDNAVVDFTAEEDGKPVTGQAEVVRFEGKWYTTGTSTGG